MPHSAPSAARQRARCSAAALAAQYADAPGEATSAFLLPTKTMDPPSPWRFISANASRDTRKYPVARMSMFFCQTASDVSSIGAADAMPAFDTRMSRPP